MYSSSSPDYKTARNILIVVLLVLGVILLLALNPFVTINAGERGVVLTWGAVTGTLDPGVHWRTPLAQRVIPVSVRTQTVSFDSSNKLDNSLGAASKDLQDVSVSVIANYHLEPSKVADIYSKYGDSYQTSIIEPMVRSVVKTFSSQYTAEELVTKRQDFSDNVEKSLAEQFTAKDVILDRVSIVNLAFSKAFTDSIEAKVTAEQSALTAKNKLEQVKYEAEQRVAQAEAEAKAIQIQAQAITQQGGESYVQLKAVEKWNGVMPTYITGGSPLPFVNVTK